MEFLCVNLSLLKGTWKDSLKDTDRIRFPARVSKEKEGRFRSNVIKTIVSITKKKAHLPYQNKQVDFFYTKIFS